MPPCFLASCGSVPTPATPRQKWHDVTLCELVLVSEELRDVGRTMRCGVSFLPQPPSLVLTLVLQDIACATCLLPLIIRFHKLAGKDFFFQGKKDGKKRAAVLESHVSFWEDWFFALSP